MNWQLPITLYKIATVLLIPNVWEKQRISVLISCRKKLLWYSTHKMD